MPKLNKKTLLSSFAFAAALVLCERPAAAQNKLSVDVGAAFPDGTNNGDGWGLGLRYGREWKLAILTLTPEFDFSYHNFSGPNDATTLAFMGGGRLGIDFIIEPSVFAHAGVGHVDGVGISQTSLGYDVGAALDLTVLPVIDFGPHLIFAGIAGDHSNDPFTWMEIGGHISFNFGG
jgi:hypothetical protein